MLVMETSELYLCLGWCPGSRERSHPLHVICTYALSCFLHKDKVSHMSQCSPLLKGHTSVTTSYSVPGGVRFKSYNNWSCILFIATVGEQEHVDSWEKSNTENIYKKFFLKKIDKLQVQPCSMWYKLNTAIKKTCTWSRGWACTVWALISQTQQPGFHSG